MKVDRAAFLELAVALAACGKDEAPPRTPVEVAVVPVSASAAASAASSAPPVASSPRRAPPLASCSLLRAPPGPACESIGWAETVCDGASRRHLPPAARDELLSCLAANNGTAAICSVEATYACAASALAAVPPAEGTAEPCARVLADCPDLPVAACQGVLTVRPPRFRERAAFCLIGPAKRCNAPGWCAFGDPDTTFIPP